MSELSAALAGVTPGHRIVDGSDVYEFSHVDQGVKVGFEKLLYQAAREALREDRAEMGDEWYERKLEELRDRNESGEYAFESPRGQKAMKSHKWAVEFLRLLVRRNGERLSWEQAIAFLGKYGVEVKSLLKTILAESFPGMKQKSEDEDPKKA